MDQKGKIAWFARWQNWVIIGLVVLAVGLMTGVIPSPFDKGDTHVDIGYILDDGTEVPLKPNTTTAIFMDPVTMRLYTNINKTTRITGIYGKLSVKPVTDMDVSKVTINWSGRASMTSIGPIVLPVDLSTLNISGSAEISPNTTTQPTNAKITVNESHFTTAQLPTTWIVVFRFDVTASAEGKTASGSAEGNIGCFWDASTGTLQLDISVSTGTLQLV